MPSRRESRYDDDLREPEADRPRRSRKQRGSSGVVRAVIIGGVILCIVGSVVGVVVGMWLGSGKNPLASAPIAKEDFQKISKDDTLASIEARFGRGSRMSVSDMERVVFSQRDRDLPRVVYKSNLTKKLQSMYGLTNPECYRWRSGGTTLYVVFKSDDPRKTAVVKLYKRQETDEKGHFHGEEIWEGFITPIGY